MLTQCQTMNPISGRWGNHSPPPLIKRDQLTNAELNSIPKEPPVGGPGEGAPFPPRSACYSLLVEIKIYSHSPILYWWPVWFVGFILAIVTALRRRPMVYVPPGSSVSARRIVAPEGAKQPDCTTPSPPVRTPGHHFFLSPLLIVFVASNVQLRGLWEWISVLAIALVVTLISLYGMWQNLVNWFTLLHIHINLAGTCRLVGFFAIWATWVFLFDRRTYMHISAGQVRCPR